MVKLLHKWQLIESDVEDDFFIMVEITAGKAHNKVTLNFIGLFLGTIESTLPSINSTFPELNATINELKEMKWIESILSSSRSGPTLPSMDLKNKFLFHKTFEKVKSDIVSYPIPEEGIIGALVMIMEQPKEVVALNTCRGLMSRITSDSIDFPHKAGNLYSIDYTIEGQEEDIGESDICIRWLRRLYEYPRHAREGKELNPIR
ncbi:berberine bridge enzyme-like D-2 [Aristolochia californica]|uniref:berberine bridge enzyme-like D-2 n=1 Tax=Aristolochia californica TaxID=171875 RepID=UPI0035D77598